MSGGGPLITNFHAAVILDLSWMNISSTFIWFLLYAHHRSKTNNKDEFLPATWSAWTKVFLSSLNCLLMGGGEASHDQDETGRRILRVTGKEAMTGVVGGREVAI